MFSVDGVIGLFLSPFPLSTGTPLRFDLFVAQEKVMLSTSPSLSSLPKKSLRKVKERKLFLVPYILCGSLDIVQSMRGTKTKQADEHKYLVTNNDLLNGIEFSIYNPYLFPLSFKY